jgi:hypothetical protein
MSDDITRTGTVKYVLAALSLCDIRIQFVSVYSRCGTVGQHFKKLISGN